MKRIPIHRDGFHQVKKWLFEKMHNQQLINNFNNMYR
jgi:hypothetical protein